ncbi:Dpy-19-like protein 1, partial [Operophtera brumata]
ERSFTVGITKLMYDRLVEFPNDVNAFNRFNIHPECHIVDRGEGLDPVQSCVGSGEPILFYLQAVWVLAGLNATRVQWAPNARENMAAPILLLQLWLVTVQLRDRERRTTLQLQVREGGNARAVGPQRAGEHGRADTAAAAVARHSAAQRQRETHHAPAAEATRVQWAPNARENMAAPILLLQLWLVTVQLRDRERRTTLQLQFILMTQIAIFFLMEQLRIIDLKTLCILLHSHFCGLHMAVLILQGNDMLKSSLYTSLFLVISAYCLFFSSLRVKVENRTDLLVESWLVVLRIAIVLCASMYLKKFISDFLEVEEDSHIWDILYSKFTNYKNFHASLYTCSDVFDFMPFSSVKKLFFSFLIPFVVLSIVNMVKSWIINALNKSKLQENDENKSTDDKKETDLQETDKESNTSDEDSGIENTEVRTHDLDLINKRISSGIETKDKLVLFLSNLSIEPAIFYNISQMLVYGVMAALVMRLKLLFVPQMCVVSALMLNKNDF